VIARARLARGDKGIRTLGSSYNQHYPMLQRNIVSIQG
jgi:hypothetical protein